MITKLRESSTLVLVVTSLVIMNYKYFTMTVTPTLTEYATATTTILAIWVGREWRAAHYTKADTK